MEPYHYDYFLRHNLIGAGLHELANKIRPLTLEQAQKDYESLKKQKPGSNLMGRIGNRASDYFFFEKRLDTGSKRGDNESFPEFFKRHGWNDAPSYKRLYKMGIDQGRNSEQAAYGVFSLYWGAINSFKAIVARAVYDKFKPHTILDFSAGWGGRCLAAMSLDINYIGFDTNTDLKKPYADMIKAFPHKSSATIHFQDSAKVDYSKYKYDMVFTSPPYYIKTKPTEAYKNMPQYKDRDEFNEKFLFPVVRNTYNNLQSGGIYALNVPMDMYDDLLPVLGKANSKILLPKIKRAGSGEGGYKEYIYFWNKGAKKIKGAGKSFASFFGYPVASELDAQEAAEAARQEEEARLRKKQEEKEWEQVGHLFMEAAEEAESEGRFYAEEEAALGDERRAAKEAAAIAKEVEKAEAKRLNTLRRNAYKDFHDVTIASHSLGDRGDAHAGQFQNVYAHYFQLGLTAAELDQIFFDVFDDIQAQFTRKEEMGFTGTGNTCMRAPDQFTGVSGHHTTNPLNTQPPGRMSRQQEKEYYKQKHKEEVKKKVLAKEGRHALLFL